MIWLLPIVVVLGVVLLGAAVLGYGALVLRADRSEQPRPRPPAHEMSGEAP